jgi:hypothetical protein
LAFEALSGQGCNWFYGFAVKENSEDLRVSITLGGEARDFITGRVGAPVRSAAGKVAWGASQKE